MGAPEWLIGKQEPRFSVTPEGDSSRGDDAVEFARVAGMTLYPWQEDLLRDMCRTDEEGLWSAPEVVVSLARQNGKGEVLLARELVGIYLFGERRVLHTAHFLDTAVEARDRLWDVISENRELMKWWPKGRPRVIRTNGKDALMFPNGAQISFRTRTAKTGRGLSIDLLVFDECFNLPTEVFAGMEPTTYARPNAQKIYISSPVNRDAHFHGAVFSAKRWAGLDGAKGVLFREWSVDPEETNPFSEEAWRAANPSLVNAPKPGVRLEAVRAASDAASKNSDLYEKYVVETLGFGKWVPRDGDLGYERELVIDLAGWRAQRVEDPHLTGESCLGVDVSPGGARVAMVAALQTEEGGIHLNLSPMRGFDREAVVSSISSTVEKNDIAAVVMDPKGPASTIEGWLGRRGVEPEKVSFTKLTEACELFLALLSEGKITHDGDPRWEDAILAADFREGAGGGRALKRFAPEGVICELVAATLAVWGLQSFADVEDVLVEQKRKYVAAEPVAVDPVEDEVPSPVIAPLDAMPVGAGFGGGGLAGFKF